MLAIGVDTGGTKIEAVLVNCDRGEVLGRRRQATPARDVEATLGVIVTLTREVATGHQGVAAVGVGAAGMVTLEGRIAFAPNLAWRDFPLRARLEEETGLPTLVDNDANTAAWGEFRFGAGRGSSHMLLVTVGTGIGGGIITGGRLYRGAHGFAAEIGHIIVEPGGPRCGCGNLGCWEQVGSGRAIDRLGRAAAREYPESELARLAGGDPEVVHGPLVTEAARKGDPLALHVLAEVGHRLGQGIAGLVNVLDPEVVVLAGGPLEAGELLLGPTRAAFREAVEAPAQRAEVPIAEAVLENAGAVGAADLAVIALSERGR